MTQAPEKPMQRWSLDFMSDQLADHRRFRMLSVVDDFSRLCPGQIVDLSISGERLARFLDELGDEIGLPEEIVMDNGPELTSKAMFDWSERTGVRLRFIEPASQRMRRIRLSATRESRSRTRSSSRSTLASATSV